MTDDLTIHFFELPKFKLMAEEVKTPLEAWLYFLRYAERMDPEELPEEIATPEIRQAVERLMQLSKIDIQKEIYEGRLKAQRDAMALSTAVAEAEARAAQMDKALATAESERAQAVARAEEAEARATAEAQARAAAEAQARTAAEAQARAAAEAQARAAAEALAKGVVVGRVELLQKLLRQPVTPTADLEAMTLESLQDLVGRLERELPR